MKVDINSSGTRYTTLEDYLYPLWGITVPAGYITDFASVPKAFWWVYPPTGYYQHAALLHDFLYDVHHLGRDLCDRKVADRRLREQMKADGVGIRTRWTFWVAVRLFGGRGWDRKTKP